jgi:hypothetical protein
MVIVVRRAHLRPSLNDSAEVVVDQADESLTARGDVVATSPVTATTSVNTTQSDATA